MGSLSWVLINVVDIVGGVLKGDNDDQLLDNYSGMMIEGWWQLGDNDGSVIVVRWWQTSDDGRMLVFGVQ